MHRSGTSALTGTLQEQGLHLGDVSTDSIQNSKGNRELSIVQSLNEDVLRKNGGSWANPPYQVSWSPFQREVQNMIISQLSHSTRPWGFKDPRTLLVLDGWQEAAPDAKFVGTFRHPLQVAASLEARDGMTRSKALQLWLYYNDLLLQQHSKQGFPLIEFEADAERMARKFEKLSSLLCLQATEAPAFYTPNLIHNHDNDQGMAAELVILYEELKKRELQI